MNEKRIREQIKQLTVQIITPKERGTGVLIQYKKRYYILTVHHVIYGKSQAEYDVDADEVKFIFHNQAEVYAINIESVGELTLLELDSKELPLSNFGAVEFKEVEYEQNYHIRGFPSGLNKPHNFSAKCNDIDRITFQIEMQNITNDTSGEDAIEYMRGVSGSGVFFSRDKKLYLVGLVNALANQSGTFNAVECINLKKIIKNTIKKVESGDIVKNIFKNLSKTNAIPQMIITSVSTNRLWYINEIKAQAYKQYRDIYHIALPIDDVSDEEYFEEIADVFGIREYKANRIRRELVRMVERSREEIFILITDFENDRHLDDFAKLMRAVLDRVGDRLRVITIGGERLANLKTNMGIHSYFNYFERHSV